MKYRNAPDEKSSPREVDIQHVSKDPPIPRTQRVCSPIERPFPKKKTEPKIPPGVDLRNESAAQTPVNVPSMLHQKYLRNSLSVYSVHHAGSSRLTLSSTSLLRTTTTSAQTRTTLVLSKVYIRASSTLPLTDSKYASSGASVARFPVARLTQTTPRWLSNRFLTIRTSWNDRLGMST